MGNPALSPRRVPRNPFFWPRLILLLILLAVIAAWAPLVATADWTVSAGREHASGELLQPGLRAYAFPR